MDAPVALQRGAVTRAVRRMSSVSSRSIAWRSDTWIVIGTTRRPVAGEHHHRHGGTGEGGEELGVARVLEAGAGQHGFLDRIRDDRTDLAGDGEFHGGFDRGDHRWRVGLVEFAGDRWRREGDVQDRDRVIGGLGGGGHDPHGCAAEQGGIAHEQEAPSRAPGGDRDFRPDPRRLAHGERGERRAHQMWMARPSTASAASFTASLSVGWAWQMRATSSAEAPNSIAVTISAISVPASGPMMWAPSRRSVVLSARILTKPSVVAHRAGAAVGGEREFADVVGDAGSLQLLPRSRRRRRLRATCRRCSGSPRSSRGPAWPARISASATPSSSALCASIGPAITSPIA